MGHNKRLNPKKTLALRCFFSPGSQTYNHLGKTARHVGCGPNTLRRWLDSPEAEQVRTEAEVEGREASLISIRMVQERLLAVAEKASAEGKHSAAVNAYAVLLRSLGGFMADRLPEANLVGKALDAKRVEDMRAIADLYYAKRYLAVDQPTVLENFPKDGAVSPQAAAL